MAIEVAAHKIAYMALPKAACSSVKSALAHLDPSVDLSKTEGFEPAFGRWHAIYPTMRFRPHRWEKYDEGWWRFCVVRDPAKRLMSCYTNRVVQLRELHNSKKLRRGEVDLPMDPDPDFFFSNLMAYKDAASSIKHHVLPAQLFLGPPPMKYDRIYMVAELGQLAKDLAKRTGTEVTMARENTSGGGLAVTDLKPATQDALRPYLAREYDYFGKWYENPLD
ncbi:hypothetical protein C1J03_12175 [Sulfitobacter sp. SK012]|uniref:sulfotransferase family 2 domain-containing protein n=1 Tax=Sulfitobacter sp. SK012 TaxID=1389005 RepID=UPI000E0B2CA7|nr:sulfotransferase family 2 domain-containing protein [Sulfitobacter sp. SK012]AXI46711.1 hypothetical protein C1J03_12175 [Sulfitobacter sp. SK012]